VLASRYRINVERHLRALCESLDELETRVGAAYADRVGEYCLSALSDALKPRRRPRGRNNAPA
jgi:hypothetical protein